MKAAGAGGFDAYAHHPYYGVPQETPTSPPRNRTEVSFAELPRLEQLLARLYPRARLWITEYGYQTNPPDDVFGVSYSAQSAYMRQAFALAERDPRVDMFVWFLLRDEPTLAGWQSGLLTAQGVPKPAWATFAALGGG
jgi:putative glycosyl hydrolase